MLLILSPTRGHVITYCLFDFYCCLMMIELRPAFHVVKYLSFLRCAYKVKSQSFGSA
jgi:hypothetical protein